jgi:hypothetical protein
MSKKPLVSLKRIEIEKGNARVLIAVGIAVFVAVFSVFAIRELLIIRAYQGRVIDKKKIALQQVQENIDVLEDLNTSYQSFVSRETNVIGGSRDGGGVNDGSNARIILDALPSSYDFPATITALEWLINNEKLNIESLGGTDDELSQQSLAASVAPEVVEMPFDVSVRGSYAGVQNLISVFERSIRPMHINTMSLTGSEQDIRMELNAKTYFKPEKRFIVEMEAVQ